MSEPGQIVAQKLHDVDLLDVMARIEEVAVLVNKSLAEAGLVVVSAEWALAQTDPPAILDADHG